jgi:hypothetical protein
MKVALSTYPGSFRIPKKARLWLLRSRRAFSIFNSVPIEESNFPSPSSVEEKDFNGDSVLLIHFGDLRKKSAVQNVLAESGWKVKNRIDH